MGETAPEVTEGNYYLRGEENGKDDQAEGFAE
jgi:hypothetical protein